MTGAGKTHTMLGSACIPNIREMGVTLYALEDCFSQMHGEEFVYAVELSYMEIYNETVIDLLTPNAAALMVVEDPSGVHVLNLSSYSIDSLEQVRAMVVEGNQRRTMAPTGGN
jgi:kinesin family protein 18/19